MLRDPKTGDLIIIFIDYRVTKSIVKGTLLALVDLNKVNLKLSLVVNYFS